MNSAVGERDEFGMPIYTDPNAPEIDKDKLIKMQMYSKQYGKMDQGFLKGTSTT
jgi:hypothetical protein